MHISLEEFALSSPIPYGAMKDLRRRLARFIWKHAGVEDEEGCESVDNDMFLMIVADLLAQKFIIYFKVSLY